MLATLREREVEITPGEKVKLESHKSFLMSEVKVLVVRLERAFVGHRKVGMAVKTNLANVNLPGWESV